MAKPVITIKIIKFKELNSATVLFTESLAIISGSGGTCSMIWPADSLDIPAGIYEGELELTDGSSKVQTVYDKLKFKVREQF